MKHISLTALCLAIAALALSQTASQKQDSTSVQSESDITNWFELRSKGKSDRPRRCTIDGWLRVELGSAGAGAFTLWESKECLEFRRIHYGVMFDDLKLAEFLGENYAKDHVFWQKFNGRLVRIAGVINYGETPTGFLAMFSSVEQLAIIGINGVTELTVEKKQVSR